MAPELLNRTPYGSTGLNVPQVAMGCAPLGNMSEVFLYEIDDRTAIDALKTALVSPFDYIDTAALYGNGESERRVGLAIKELGGLPEDAVLQTKQGRDPETNDYSGETVRRRMERSLELLGVDHLDTVFLHDAEWTTFDEAMRPGGPVEVLRGYQAQGVFDYLGIASGPNDVELEYVRTGLFDAVITHNRYTLLSRIADPVIQEADDRGMAVLNAAPYGSGILARGAQAYPRYAYQQASEDFIQRTRDIEAICERNNIPLAAAALQFSMLDPRIDVTIVGMSRPERIQQTVDLASIDIPESVWEEIAALPPLVAEDPETERWKSSR